MPFVILIIIILGPLIYFSDRGPIFYNAPRSGKDFKIFKMYKLRSMKMNAPDIRNADGSTFSSDDDPRVTKIGRFIRKTSLDEFPQFFNVLIGDMSFVGPRPILPSKDHSNFTDCMNKRMTVKPGVTGYSQAYFRNSISSIEKFQYDADYVDLENLCIDIKILVKTFTSVIFRQNINIKR